jgi:hypothetical protein
MSVLHGPSRRGEVDDGIRLALVAGRIVEASPEALARLIDKPSAPWARFREFVTYTNGAQRHVAGHRTHE